MVLRDRPWASFLVIVSLLPLVGCTDTPWGQALQRSLEVDPKLTGEASPSVSPSPTSSPTGTPSLPSPTASATTEISGNVALGLVGTSEGGLVPIGAAPTPSTIISASFNDLETAPKELQSYVADVAALGVLTVSPKSSPAVPMFAPNQAITRRDYARWLFAINNRLNADRPTQQLRSGIETATPAFQDIPKTDPDFAVIQGLAEAGILPSPLSGDSTTVVFRPDQPLTREVMLLWKVPMDTRQALPKATLEAIQQTWGFQDAAKIDPVAQRAVLADFQNGDRANIRRAFGYTTLFQPKKPVSRAEAAASLWYLGSQGEGLSAQEALRGTKEPTKVLSPSPAANLPSASPTPVGP